MGRGKVFLKPHGANPDVELQRLACLQAVCDASGVMCTAAVQGVDTAAKAFVCTRLEALEPLSLAPGQAPAVFFDLGQRIAQLHLARPALLQRSLRALDWERQQLSEAGLDEQTVAALLQEFPVGFAHADLWHGNLLRRQGRWVILDPIPSGLILKGIGLQAAGIFDLANLHMSLFACRKLKDIFSNIGMETSIYGEALLDGYLQQAGVQWMRPAVVQLSRHLALQWVAAYRGRLLLPLTLIKRQMFERNFSSYYEGAYEAP